ncbi:WD G-beta repeat containing protein [Babesia ovis]|uniref:WD G-beta repeat containing protein n=1 Tax=Babesia ovis TaxID=5869 RepID=A0A9W5WU71_BABOV|nr:WD G-beta repeat containing protein [Babesia ovis]
MGTYIKLSKIAGLRESHPEVFQYDGQIKRFFNASKVVGSGKESSPVNHVAFSPKGNVVSICSATKVIYYNYLEEKVIHTYSDPKEFVRCCAFRSDGKVSAVTDDGGWIQLVALELKSNLKKWRAHDAACHAAAFSPIKVRIMTGSDDGVAKLWDTVTGEMLEQFNFHTDKIRTMAHCGGSEHLWVSGGYDSLAYLFDDRDNTKPVAKVNHGAPIEFVEVSESSNILLTAGGNKVNLWDMSGGLRLLHSFEPHQRTVVRGYIRDSILTASLDGTVRYFNHSSIQHGEYLPEELKKLLDATDKPLDPAEDGSEFQESRETTSPITDNQHNGPSSTETAEYAQAKENVGSEYTLQNIETVVEVQSDNSTFVTPMSSMFSPKDRLTPMSDNNTINDATFSTPIGKEANVPNAILQHRLKAAEGAEKMHVKSASESKVSLRHVYRFNDPVTAFAVSLDARSIAVGTSAGEWIIRHNSKEQGIVVSQPKKIIKIDDTIVEYKTPKLSLLDRLVKTFQYQAAMELALSLTPEHVYNLVESLVLRGSLATAVRGKDEQSILPLLRFVSTQLGNDIRNTNTLLELANAIIDNNPWMESCDNAEVLQELRKIPSKINLELYQHNILHTLDGTIDLILNRSVATSDSMN